VLLIVTWASSAGQAADREEAPGILVADRTEEVEFRLPGPYWEHFTRAEISDRTRGGCAGRRVPPELLFVLGHKDAECQVLLLKGNRRFLMRNRDDLETFVQASVQSITKQIGSAGSVIHVEKPYREREGMIVHRFAFRAPARGAGGGCVPVGGVGGQQAMMRYLFVDYFVRPKGEDALNLQARCFAAADVYEDLADEVEFIVSSVRHTGEPADEYFVADAPAEKVLTAKEVAEASGGGKSGMTNMLLLAGLIVVVWLLLRRKKQPST
jgi:hypothetical protein